MSQCQIHARIIPLGWLYRLDYLLYLPETVDEVPQTTDYMRQGQNSSYVFILGWSSTHEYGLMYHITIIRNP